MKLNILDRYDKLGSVLSSLCAVHCLCMPVLVGMLPMLGLTFLANPTLERIVAVSMILFATACLWAGCRYHRRWALFSLLGAGAALVLYIQFAGPPEDAENREWKEAGFMACGGSLIAVSHLLNRRLRAGCDCRHCAGRPKNQMTT